MRSFMYQEETVVKKLLPLLIVVALVIPLSTVTAQGGDTVELQVVWMGWPEEQVTPVMDAFAAAYPNIQIAYERIPFSDIFQTLEVRLSARSPEPDIYMVDGPLTGSYAARGHLLALEDVYGDDIEGFTAAALAQGTYDGQLYSAPFASSSQLLFYNKDLFEAAGIEPPTASVDERWTWEQVKDVAAQLSDPDNEEWGIIIEQADRPYQILAIPESYGAEVIGPDGLTAEGYVDSPEFVAAIEFYQSLFTEGLHPVGTDNYVNQELFGTGRSAMFIGGPWNLTGFDSQFPDLNWGVAAHPYFEGGEAVTPTGSWHIGINPRSEHLEEAADFVRFMTTDLDLRKMWFELRQYVPVRQEMFEADIPAFSTDAYQIILYEVNNTAVPRPATPGYREYEDILLQAFRDVQLGGDVQEILHTAAVNIDVEFEKYR
jgi:ABC-type glycerol-3-phosphate transport system substrate-binding protein